VNSVLVATLTMILSIGFGAPAGYALSRFDFPGKGTFRFLVLMTRAFRCRCCAATCGDVHPHRPRRHRQSGGTGPHTAGAAFAVLITFSLFSAFR